MAAKLNECRKVDLDFFDRAPLVIQSEVTLQCSPQTLFLCFEDADAWPDWVSVIKKVEWTSSLPIDVGTTRTVHMPAGMIAREEFIAWDKPRHMAFRFNQFNRSFLSAFAEDYQVKDIGKNRCHLLWTVGIEPNRVRRSMAPLLKPFIAWHLQRIIKDLERYMRKEGRRFRLNTYATLAETDSTGRKHGE